MFNQSNNQMASQFKNELHFVLIPLMSPSHLIPMIDMAKLLASHGVFVTIVTTPLNAMNFTSTIQRATQSGHKIRLLQLRFPAQEAGLPASCESMDKLPSRSLIRNFFNAASMLQQQFEQVFPTLNPRPSCIISGKNLPWTVEFARKFNIPRIFFDAMGCFSFSCTNKIEISQAHENLSKFETFIVPDLPHRIELCRAKLPEALSGTKDLKDVRDNIRNVENIADGIVVNTFEELEKEYIKEYVKGKGTKNIWCIGPVSASNKLNLDKAERGQKASIDETQLLKWLDKQEQETVIYACLGSISGLTTLQLVELGLGLEASNQPFIWVIRNSKKSKGIEKWILDECFEERNKEKGLIISGWSPQVLILSHKAIGGFLTHCGWNSTLEGVTAGVPIIACPLFAEQFINEKLVVEVLGIGASVGVESAILYLLEDEFGLVMKREQVKKAIEMVMDKGEEGEERRRRAKELGFMAKKAIEEGGSSYINMEMLIQFVSSRVQSE